VKVAVLMSGGIDSTMAALLLKEQGYDISGLTMINWDSDAARAAAQAARFLGINHEVVDLQKVFYHQVIEYFYPFSDLFQAKVTGIGPQAVLLPTQINGVCSK
jgi:tRNA U34 2-thiouridine synthase MnmA/TrmU